MKSLAVFLGLVVLASASYFTYHGKYPGSCGYDGLYYKDDYSFVYCSNGNAYVQPCAPGTRNSAYGTYSSGNSYGYRDFCDVNLVDYGYAAYHGHGYGHGHGHGGYDGGYGGGYGGYGHGGYGHGGYGHGGHGHGHVIGHGHGIGHHGIGHHGIGHHGVGHHGVGHHGIGHGHH
jgi:hypothetical protein